MKKSLGLLAMISIFCIHSLWAQQTGPDQAGPRYASPRQNGSKPSGTGQPNAFAFAGFSMNQYLGDLQATYPAYTGALSLGMQLNRGKRLNGSFELSYGSISGQHINYTFGGDETATPNPFFSSTVFGAHYNLHLNILKKKTFTLYLSQGLGLLRYMPVDDRGRKLQDRFGTRAANEVYSNSSVILPSNLGFIYLLPNHWGLGLQAGYLNSLTDYLDNISKWGNKAGNDNILRFRFAVYLPVNK